MNSFTLTFTRDQVLDLIASYLDDVVFTTDVASVSIPSLTMQFNPDGSLRVSGTIGEES